MRKLSFLAIGLLSVALFIKAELGISLLKRALISYKLQTRGDTWINGRSVITSVYPDYEDGSYKTTVVMNDTMDNKTVSGQYYITNK